jgi:soluble lytic murein transglycosylase-like protein
MPTNRERYEPIVRAAARDFKVDETIAVQQCLKESNFNPSVESPSGAYGLMQISTRYWPEARNWTPTENARFGMRLMREHLDHYNEDYALALAAYNAGRGAMDRWFAHFGLGWRQALQTNRHEWGPIAVPNEPNASWAKPEKADQVRRYLDAIVG